MPKKLHFRLPLFSTRATAVMSVALVLVILGLAAMVGLATRRISDSVRENMGYVAILSEGTTTSEIEDLMGRLRATPGVRDVAYSSSEAILERWQHIVGDEEDILRLAGVNPFSPEIEVYVLSSHASPDSIHTLCTPIGLLPQVADVRVMAELVDTVGSTLHSITVTLLFMAIALLAVSFVLIFNTVRLTVYSRRFLIHTMQLVGATPSFIRRPFVFENFLNGLFAGLIASVLLAATLYGASSIDTAIGDAVFVKDAVIVMAGMIITGVVICLVASWMACNRYLSLTYSQLFK